MKNIYLSVLFLFSICKLEAQQYEWLQGFETAGQTAIKIDRAGNSYTIVHYRDSINEYTPPWYWDTLLRYTIIKRDKNNNFQWSTSFSCDSSSILRITFNKNNEAFLNGFFSGHLITPGFTLTSNGNHDIAIIKLNHNGTMTLVQQIGGAGDEWGNCVIDSHNNIIVSGRYYGTGTFGNLTYVADSSSYCDFFIVAFNPAGVLLWSDRAKATDIPYTSHFCCGVDLKIDNDDNIYPSIAGDGILQSNSLRVGGGDYGAIVYKFNSAGSYLAYYYVGESYLQWTVEYYFDNSNNVCYARNLGQHHGATMCDITRSDQLNNIVWNNRYGNGDYYGADYTINGFYCNNSNYYAIGVSDTTINGTREFFKIGDLQTGTILQTFNEELNGTYITEDDDGAFYISGYFAGSKTLGPFTINSLYSDRSSPFILKLRIPIMTGQEELTSSSFSIFPNPTSSSFTINCPLSIVNSQLKIYNYYGQLINSQIINQQSTVINLQSQPKGIYIIEAGNERRKIVLN